MRWSSTADAPSADPEPSQRAACGSHGQDLWITAPQRMTPPWRGLAPWKGRSLPFHHAPSASGEGGTACAAPTTSPPRWGD